MRKMKRKLKLKNLFLAILLIAILLGSFSFYTFYESKNKKESKYLASDTGKIILYNEELKQIKEVVRGNKINIYPNQILDENYFKAVFDQNIYYVNKNDLVETYEETVKEKTVYARTSYNLKDTADGTKLLDLVNKGEKLEIIGFDKILDNGDVNMYKVKTTNNKEGYFYRKYIVFDENESKLPYDKDGIYKFHAKRNNPYGGGSATTLDYYPVEKPQFANNVMPKKVYSLYLNGLKSVIKNIDNYIKFAKETKINAFVVDVKESGITSYSSPVMKKYSPTSFKRAQNSFDDYKKAMKKVKDAGIYLIGRISTFKDEYYIADNKDKAISDNNNRPFYHQSSYWPTAYNRNVWEYNVLLAKEAIQEMGFNEIQFDYVRFPDGLSVREKNKTVNYKNIYNETKAEAIQRFLMYATNEIHELNAYVSADVFGESSWGYVTAYGQYWPAISNVVDVISAMPYTDHFGKVYGGYDNPWEYPYEVMLTWGKSAKERQKEIKTPAIARTWITAYNTPYYAPYVTYDGPKLSAQIDALFKLGLNGGYMTWNNSSNLNRYRIQKSAFMRDY